LGDAGPEWHSLARRLISAIDAERLVGVLLREKLGEAKPASPQLAEPREVAVLPETAALALPAQTNRVPSLPQRERNERQERQPRSRDDRERGGRDRGRPRREHDDCERRGSGNTAKPVAADKPIANKPAGPSDHREFWEVWSEEVGRTATPTDTPSTVPSVVNPLPGATEGVPLAAGQARLYVNLGRKDNASADLVAELLSSTGIVVPVRDVELMNTHSYINVAQENAEKLCTAVRGLTHNGRTVLCEPARPPKRR
jgi:hypothetical protein